MTDNRNNPEDIAFEPTFGSTLNNARCPSCTKFIGDWRYEPGCSWALGQARAMQNARAPEDIAIQEAVRLQGRLWSKEDECRALMEFQQFRDAPVSWRTLGLVALACVFVLGLAWAIGTALAEWGAR